MQTPTPEHNSQLNAIKEIIRGKVSASGYHVTGQFISGTNQSEGYMAYIFLKNKSGTLVNHFGLPLDYLANTDECVRIIVDDISKQHVPEIFES